MKAILFVGVLSTFLNFVLMVAFEDGLKKKGENLFAIASWLYMQLQCIVLMDTFGKLSIPYIWLILGTIFIPLFIAGFIFAIMVIRYNIKRKNRKRKK